MEEARLVYQDSKGGYLVVVVNKGEKGEPIELQKHYFLGANKSLPALSLKEVEALIISLRDVLDAETVGRSLLQVGGADLFYRDEKGRIKRLSDKADPLLKLVA